VWNTNKHLSIIDGIGVLEEVKASGEGRVLHVERKTGADVPELLDSSFGLVGIALEGASVLRTERTVSCTPFGT